jgi:hypothetical protein
MSTNSQDQEIDLGQVFQKINGLFQSLVNKIFDVILFIKRNSIYIGLILIIGLGLGYYMDKTNKTYTHEVIVTPNYSSVDYLYSKIALLNAKKIENDTLFFKELGFKNIKKLGSIKIEPIIDIYKFIDGNPENFDLIKLMAEDGDLTKIIENEVTSKNYPYHSITFSTKENTSLESTVKPLLKFLNDSEYYSSIKTQYLENQKNKFNTNDSIIKQIDKLVEGFSKSASSASRTDKMVYISDNNQINEIINTKNNLIKDQGDIKISLLNNDEIIKEVSSTLNIKATKGLNGKMKLVVPVVFLFLFFVFVSVKNFYKNQLAKRNLA